MIDLVYIPDGPSAGPTDGPTPRPRVAVARALCPGCQPLAAAAFASSSVRTMSNRAIMLSQPQIGYLTGCQR